MNGEVSDTTSQTTTTTNLEEAPANEEQHNSDFDDEDIIMLSPSQDHNDIANLQFAIAETIRNMAPQSTSVPHRDLGMIPEWGAMPSNNPNSDESNLLLTGGATRHRNPTMLSADALPPFHNSQPPPPQYLHNLQPHSHSQHSYLSRTAPSLHYPHTYHRPISTRDDNDSSDGIGIAIAAGDDTSSSSPPIQRSARRASTISSGQMGSPQLSQPSPQLQHHRRRHTAHTTMSGLNYEHSALIVTNSIRSSVAEHRTRMTEEESEAARNIYLELVSNASLTAIQQKERLYKDVVLPAKQALAQEKKRKQESTERSKRMKIETTVNDEHKFESSQPTNPIVSNIGNDKTDNHRTVNDDDFELKYQLNHSSKLRTVKGSVFCVGRLDSNDIQISDEYPCVSRIQAFVFIIDDNLIVLDGWSANGTETLARTGLPIQITALPSPPPPESSASPPQPSSLMESLSPASKRPQLHPLRNNLIKSKSEKMPSSISARWIAQQKHTSLKHQITSVNTTHNTAKMPPQTVTNKDNSADGPAEFIKNSVSVSTRMRELLASRPHSRHILTFHISESIHLRLGGRASLVLNPKLCVVCYENARLLRTECGHFVLCNDCFETIRMCGNMGQHRCPICRAPLQITNPITTDRVHTMVAPESIDISEQFHNYK